MTKRHHCCAVSHETSFSYNTSVFRPRPTLVHPQDWEAWRTNGLVPHTVGGEEMDALEERLDGGAPGRAEHDLSGRGRRMTTEPLTRPPTEAGNRQELRATEATLRPCARRAPLPTPRCWMGHCSDRVTKKPIKSSTGTHPHESSTSCSLVDQPLGAHRDGRPTKTRGNRSHPPPLREGSQIGRAHV